MTVITSSIGRPELRRCIESVWTQSYPVKHFVYVNGPKYHESARAILQDFPDIHAIYLPEETGDYNGSGYGCGDVFAAAPFFTNSDWVFFLNDDDFYDPGHVESVMDLVAANDLKWAYSLRRFVDITGQPICDDDWCSLGHLTLPNMVPQIVDNSCFAVSRPLAEKYGRAWTAMPTIGDRCFFMALKDSGARSGCTGLSTVNYRAGTGTAPNDPALYLACAARMRSEMPGGFPWRKAQVFG